MSVLAQVSQTAKIWQCLILIIYTVSQSTHYYLDTSIFRTDTARTWAVLMVKLRTSVWLLSHIAETASPADIRDLS